MKKIYLIVFSVLLLQTSIAQNYLSESIKIVDIGKYSQSEIKFKIVNGFPKPESTNDQNNFDAVLAKVVAFAKSPKNTSGLNNQSGSQQKVPSAGGSKQPQAGASNQPGSDPARQPDEQTVAASNNNSESNKLSAQEEDEYRNELTWILFLKWNNNAHDYKQVTENFPKKFSHLDIIQKGIFNSTMGLTNFAFSESAIIYGITDFVIKRAKQELVEVYLGQWYNKANSNPIISKLAPQTLSVTYSFMQDNNLNVTKYGDKWKAAFQEDLRNIPIQLQDESLVTNILNTAGIIDNDKKQITPIIAGGDEIAYNLYLKKHLVNILNDMSYKYINQGDTSPAIFKQLVVLANVILQTAGELKNNTTYYPATLDDINKMTIDSWKILLKLIYVRQNDGLTYVFSNQKIDKLFTDMLEKTSVDQFSRLYKQTVSFIGTYQQLISVSQQEATHQLTFNDTRKLFDLAFQLIDQTHNYLSLYPGVLNCPKADYEKYIKPYYLPLAEIGEGLSTQQYGKVLDGTASILTKLNTNNKLNDELKFIQVYGSFMINILNSKTSDDVEKALDELIPSGQYQLKNTKKISVSVSAYPGCIASYESIKKYKVDGNKAILKNELKEDQWAPSLGFYLPIGADFSIGHKKVKQKNGNATVKYNSTNIFIQIIDLGAVLNYRLTGNDSNVSANPNITFKQILSPGIAIMHHLNNSPLVYGANVNYTPELRTISQGGNTYQSNSFRFGIFIGVDVTFINFVLSKKNFE